MSVCIYMLKLLIIVILQISKPKKTPFTSNFLGRCLVQEAKEKEPQTAGRRRQRWGGGGVPVSRRTRRGGAALCLRHPAAGPP